MTMERLRLTWVLFFLGSTTSILQADDAPKPLRLTVVTYNIRIGTGGRKERAAVDLEPVAKTLERLAADVVGLQEVDRLRKRSQELDEPEWLAQRLHVPVVFVPALFATPGEMEKDLYGIAVLSKHPLAAAVRHSLFTPEERASRPDHPDPLSETRALLQTRIDVGGRTVHLFNTHLGLSPEQRERQVKEIIEAMAKVDGPRILTGDFNAEPEEAGMKPLYAAYREVLAETKVPRAEQNSYPGGASPVKAIDHIFFSPEFRVLNAKVVRDETPASDHNPVIAELELVK